MRTAEIASVVRYRSAPVAETVNGDSSNTSSGPAGLLLSGSAANADAQKRSPGIRCNEWRRNALGFRYAIALMWLGLGLGSGHAGSQTCSSLLITRQPR